MIEKDSKILDLPPLYREIAAKNLNESDETRSQALQQLRKWISADSTVKNVRIDASFLLKFLRVKKFNVNSSYLLFKEYLTAFHDYPKWFSKLSVDEELILELIRDGVLIPLPNRDTNGCQTVIYNLRNLNPAKFNQHDFFRLHALMFHVLFEDEETQIAGFSVIFNFSGMDLRRYAMFSIVDFNNFCKTVRFAIPVRVFKVYVINMPKIVQPLYEIATRFLTPKLKKRLKVLKNQEELKKVVDLKDFPKEFGGESEMKEILEEFVAKMKGRKEEISKLNDMKIETLKSEKGTKWSLQEKIGNEIFGSFRKLTVD
ncbi:retinaldehyde-binding protein 1-like [Culicoides brevitarsis]|uniref:retinaldehyde-binding protein 1-like n=1 Tax=Culicoides brevitarsis TaxID=469753 RepID=UPI00307C2136